MPFVMMLLFWLAVAAVFAVLLGVAWLLSVRSLAVAKREAGLEDGTTEDVRLRIGPLPEFMRRQEAATVEEATQAGAAGAAAKDLAESIRLIGESFRQLEETSRQVEESSRQLEAAIQARAAVDAAAEEAGEAADDIPGHLKAGAAPVEEEIEAGAPPEYFTKQ